MEHCLGLGSRRTIKAQKDLQQLKAQHQHQQQPQLHSPNQNYYTQQQPQSQRQAAQAKRECGEVILNAPITTTPKFAANCLHFPPPPDYPPPPKTPTATKVMPASGGGGGSGCIANQKPSSISATKGHLVTTSATPTAHQTRHHQHQQQQQQQHQGLHAVDNVLVGVEAQIGGSNANYSSSASSPSSSSATSATTIGFSACSRRHVQPRYPDPDPDAIEVCVEQEPLHASLAARSVKTLGHTHHHQQHNDAVDVKWSAGQQTTSMQMLHPHAQHVQHAQHDYSYAYYEPGAAMRHSNVPPPEQTVGGNALRSTPPPPNSIRALLSKGKKNKLLVSAATRQSYQTRLGVDSACGSSADSGGGGACGNAAVASGTLENFYEEISSASEARQLRPTATSHSAGSLNQSLVEEELRRVQSHHRKILGELNLSVEAMLMPESPPSSSPTSRAAPTVSVTNASGQPALSATVGIGQRLSSSSADNICEADLSELLTVGPTDDLISPMQNSANAAFCADLDSGFSGSSGASYIGSLRLHKTNAALSHLLNARHAGNRAAAANSGVGMNPTQLNVAATAASCAFTYGEHTCMATFQRAGRPAAHEDDTATSGFLTRASCGRRILNCAKIRAAEDPGPVVPTESKARSFWNRKGWRKLPGFASTSSINDTGLTDEHKLNAGSWEDPLPTSANNLHGCSTTITTAQLHNAASSRRHDPSNVSHISYNDTHTPLVPLAAHSHQHHHPHPHTHQPHTHHQHSKSCGSPTSAGRTYEAELAGAAPLATAGSTIAGGSFSANGGSAAVGVSTTTATTTTASDSVASASVNAKKPLEHATADSWCEEHTEPSSVAVAVAIAGTAAVASTSDEEAVTEDEPSVTSLSATNQRNSQLRSTFNRAKQHLSFDKWRTNSSSAGNAANNNSSNCAPNSASGNADNSGSQARRASACTMPTAHQSPRDDLTTPGESPGGRLSRWFSIRRGSSHQYDVGGRDGRQSSSSSLDIPDAAAIGCGEPHASPQKQINNASCANSRKMPGVPENEDDDALAAATTRFDLDLMLPPGSRANGTANNAHARLINPMLPPAPPGLSQQQLKRRHIVAAIVHSENSYVATLQRLVNDYKKPLEDSSPPVLSATKIATLFHRLPEILQSHKLFRIALAESVRNWDRDEKLGDCFVSAFSKSRILEIYSGFINNFSAAMELAKMEEKRKSALADFFKVKQISAHDRLSFFGLMVKPVQRFPQFILFLQDLLKYTPQGHHDRMSLQLALTQLELLAEMLNERKREAEQYQGFKEMLGHISGTFNTRSLATSESNRPRYLLREDNVTHIEFNQAGFIVKSKQRRLLLLNDKVICVSVAPKQSHDFGATEKLTFKWMYPVTDVEIVENSTSATLSRILTAGLNRGGSLKSNSSSCNAYNTSQTLPAHAAHNSTVSSMDATCAAQLSNGGADNLCNEMSTLMYDYEVISRIHDLVGSLKGTYKELNSNTTRNLLNTIQSSIQRKDEEMAWVDSCCLQLIARTKSGKEETFTFQTQSPNVKKEWITELRLAQLALDANNSPAWEASSTEPSSGNSYEAPPPQQQQQWPAKQPNKMPLFVKAMPVYKSQHQTEVRCGCYYTIANDIRLTGNARRRHKQLNYLWVCTSDGTSSHIAVLSQHHQQAGNLRDVGSFDLVETQVTAIDFVKGVEATRSAPTVDPNSGSPLLGDLIWLGTDSRKLLIYSARNPEQEEQLGCCAVPGAVMRVLYHFDCVYVALANAMVLIYRRASDGLWQLKEPQQVLLGEAALPVPSLLPINMHIYAACANRVYVLNAWNGELQRSFEVQHGASQQVNLMAHSGIGLWISLRNSTVLCLYHTETFKHLQDINIAASILRSDGKKKEQPVNNSSIYVTALMACKGLLWVGTNVGIAVTIPLPRLEGVPIISGGINMSRHAHFGPITFLLPLIPKVYPSYKPPPQQPTPAQAQAALLSTAEPNSSSSSATPPPPPPPPPSMGEDLQLPAIDADPKKLSESDLEESVVILRRDLPKDDSGSSSASLSACMLRDDVDSTASSPRSSKLDKQHSLDQSFSAKIRASLANSPAFHRKRFRDLSAESARTSKTLPRGLGSASFGNANLHSNTSTLNHGEHGCCDVYGLYGKLIFVKEDYDAEEGAQGNLMDMMYEGMRRSDPELAAIPLKVSTLDRRLRMKASRPRSLDLSNWSVDSKSSSLYTSSGSEESMGIRCFGGRSVSRNSSSASYKTSGNGSDLGNISENGLMTTVEVHQHSTPKSEDGFKLMGAVNESRQAKLTPPNAAVTPSAAATATLKRKQKQSAKQQQQQNADGPRTIITLMGGRGYWRHHWYNNANSPGNSKATLNSNSSSGSSGSSSPLVANSNDAHIVVWEKKL